LVDSFNWSVAYSAKIVYSHPWRFGYFNVDNELRFAVGTVKLVKCFRIQRYMRSTRLWLKIKRKEYETLTVVAMNHDSAPKRASIILHAPASFSKRITCRFCCNAATPVVPEPAQNSTTVAPGAVMSSMNFSISAVGF